MIIFATTNKGKLEEAQEIMPGIVSLEEVGVSVEVIEDSETYEENAMKKAVTIMEITGKPTIADDSGLEIEFFDGKPGINTSTFLMGNDRYKERNLKIIEMMQGADNRKAKFVCVIALAVPDGGRFLAHGYLEGFIANEPKGEFGHAYDSIFYVEEYMRTLAEMETELKNKISHRGKALGEMKGMMQL